ncbi:ig-like domain-containing protein [Caerostris extrusa]|uniref:Ig-like domain-containing protein n=1 Tax=Caerostris extrusa TaxID=172846 RepID=A0AAV4XPW3_CAEEX|nr:ig-like domain-containing protein [Caerostris extrusa]
MWVPNQLIGALVGGNVTLECTSEAFPDSLNYWSRIKDIVVSDINENGRMKVIFRIMSYKIHMLLNIYPVMPSDFGLYECFAKNSLGTTEGTIRLYGKSHIIYRYY